MKVKLLFIALTFCLMFTLCFSVSAMSGTGTEADPYIIETADDFVSIKNNIYAHYKLNNDIAVSSTEGAIVENFNGVFDGNGHTVDVTIYVESSSKNTYDSLFGVVNGYIKNLIVTGNIYGSDKVAGVVGKLTGGNVDSCINYATITGKKNVGGIVGLVTASGTVTNCVNFGTVKGHMPIDKGLDMGGIVGCVWTLTDKSAIIVSNCYNAGTVFGDGYNAGGVLGHIEGGSYKNLFNIGNVSITSTTNSNRKGEIVAALADTYNSYHLDGYYMTSNNELVGFKNNKTFTTVNPMFESAGVAIYLGSGSGIRGEFHINKSVFAVFSSLLKLAGYNVEYGAVVSLKDAVEMFDGNLISSEAKESGAVVFAPAIKDGVEQYGYNDSVKGENFHSFRFALTGFDEASSTYNIEFVILGYVLISNEKSEQIFPLNTVKSDRLASAVGETGLNSVSIVRVAEASLEDGDFVGNDLAIDKLTQIVSNKDYSNKIEIDGNVGYGHLNAKVTTSVSSDDTVVFQITNTTNAEFIAYTHKLLEAGYTKIATNTINGNQFYTFTNGNSLIHAVYTLSDSKTTISYETITNLPSNFEAPIFDKKNDPTITQLTQNASVNEGMSYVIHLSDGKFFIIDGGWSDDDAKEADRLYNQLVSLADGNEIVIAGWIFTHCHGDHIGTFNIFVEKYHNNVVIEELLYNFPTENDIANSGSSYMLNSTKQRYPYFKFVIEEYLSDTKIVKLHSGYKFYYADLEIEILQTLEDLYPKTVANYDFNSSSTIFTITISGQKMLFLGDISDVGASRLNSAYGESLKSDFMQIAHHGLNSTSVIKELYIYADAKYILYPAPLSWFNSNKSGANFYIETESRTVEQIFVSGAGTVEIYLPYDGALFDGDKTPNIKTEEPDAPVRNEVSRPQGTVDVPDAYFDLDLSNGTPTDAMGNATVTVTGGYVADVTVTHGDKESTTSAFTGDMYDKNNRYYYLSLDFDKINTENEWANFVMGSSTFEIFLKLDKLPGETVGLITSCNGGGVTLYLRKQAGGQINFQLGSTKPNSNTDDSKKYSATVAMKGNTPLAVANDLLHIVGSYNSDTNTMSLYINGILIAEVSYGDGAFSLGSGNDCVLGICYNPQYNNSYQEAISKYTNYELYEAKIYNTSLTSEQVAQEYWNCIDNLFKTEDVQ